MNKKTSIKKIVNWEYWPSLMFYIPNIPFALLQIIKAKSLVFFTATNPGIKSSGIGTESKYETLQLLPEKHLPKTVFHKANSKLAITLNKIYKEEISFPLIAKPDIGFRGLLVKKIDTEKELIQYLNTYPIDIIIQEFLTEKNECGIFYHRFPNQKEGKITSITLKEFLHVTGDGISNLKELIINDQRAKFYLDLIIENNEIDLTQIINKGIVIKLSSIGNHSKGTRFINGNHLISRKLETVLDALNNQSNGWYYGRLDIKYNTFEDIENSNFKIIELNGILAEPTHIYDAQSTTYFKALKEIRFHWKSIYKIAVLNNKKYNIPYKNTKAFSVEIFELKKYINQIKKMSNFIN